MNYCIYGLWVLSLCAAEYHTDALLVPAPREHSRPRTEQTTITKPTMLVLHYTEETLPVTLKIFSGQTEARVAPHYTIAESGLLFCHVTEDRAARHAGQAGVSYWRGEHSINNVSIGIEHVNLGFKKTSEMPSGIHIIGSEKEWYPFACHQLLRTVDLCRYLQKKYAIDSRNIVGHSDVAPGRKIDPGPLFRWDILAQEGIGAWPHKQRSTLYTCLKKALLEHTLEDWLITHLHYWGYKQPDGTATKQQIIQAFQMHFRARIIDGVADQDTATVLQNLLYTYCGNECPCCP